MEMARVGQGATQAPQPVHCPALKLGWATPPLRGRKRMACVGQASPQIRHSTPVWVRQPGPMEASNCWAGVKFGVKAPEGQDCTHCWQKVHSPSVKSSVG